MTRIVAALNRAATTATAMSVAQGARERNVDGASQASRANRVTRGVRSGQGDQASGAVSAEALATRTVVDLDEASAAPGATLDQGRRMGAQAGARVSRCLTGSTATTTATSIVTNCNRGCPRFDREVDLTAPVRRGLLPVREAASDLAAWRSNCQIPWQTVPMEILQADVVRAGQGSPAANLSLAVALSEV